MQGLTLKDHDFHAEAENAFGSERADALFGDFVKRWGPIIGPIMLKLVLGWMGVPNLPGLNAVPLHALVSGDTLRHWAAALLREHQPEVEAAVAAQVHTIVTAGIDALDA